jgi:spermidine/putrescine transport system permease protein
LPYIIWAGLFIILPILLVVYYSFSVETGGRIIFSLDNYRRLFDPFYINVLRRSITLALSCTAICIAIGYPVAYILASREYVTKGFLLFLFLVPMWMNYLLRTYAWVSILERNGFINSILDLLGLPGLDMLYTNSAVLLGMVYNFLPFMILPIYSVLRKRDQGLVEAAQDLGANPRQVFFRLTLPLSIPGIISGVTMVFMPATSTFIIADLLGGTQNMLIGNLIEQQFFKANNWHFGSAVSVMLMALLIVSFAILSRVDKDSGEGVLF